MKFLQNIFGKTNNSQNSNQEIASSSPESSSLFPLVKRNFLSLDVCNQLVEFCKRSEKEFGALGQEFWQGRSINLNSIHNPNIEQVLLDARQRMTSVLQTHLGAEKTIYPELLQLVRWVPGYELKPHADKENPDGVPHPYSWRDFAGIVYLNDDYEGGNIYFPNQKLDLKPEAGTFATFPGTLEYLHGVREVTIGTRYTIASFFTKTKACGDDLDQRFGLKNKAEINVF